MAVAPSKIVAVEHLTLDGVYQAPARADEDTRGGFKHGGWSEGDHDPELQEAVGQYMGGGWALLAGRTTYEDLYEGWHVRQPSSPMTKALTDVQKFVVTRSRDYSPAWDNSTVLAGDAAQTVAKLKAEIGKPLIIFGSGELVRSLMPGQLVDDFLLMIHPIVVGQGRRLFDAALPLTKFRMTKKLITSSGVIVATYQPAVLRTSAQAA
jgi:dihydrofolate reductase